MNAPDLTDARWIKSSFSSNNGNCVELAGLADGRVAVRDSKNPHGGALILARSEMAAFLHVAKRGEFDQPTG